MTGDAPHLPPARVRTRRAPNGGSPSVTPRTSDPRYEIGPAPVTVFEDRAQYEARLASLLEDLAPSNAIERMWVKDIADLDWESDRLKRAKAVAIALGEEGALTKIVKSMASGDASRAMELTGGERGEVSDYLMARAYAQRSAEEVANLALEYSAERIRRALGKFGLSEAQTGDAALLQVIQTVERLDRLIQIAGRRRDAIIRELERRRSDRAIQVTSPPPRATRSV